MTDIYLDILGAKRKETFLALKSLYKHGTLAGETALALQLKHRYSFDLDIFFDKPNVEIFLQKLKPHVGIKERKINLPNNQTFFTKNNIQITLFYYEFKPLYPKIKTPSLSLYYYKDIAADKAYALGRRPVWRDYVDLFYLLKEKQLGLKVIIKDAEKKFGSLFAEKLFLEQLTFYDDIQNFNINFIAKNYSPKTIKEFLKKEVLLYTNKYYILN